MTFPVHVVIVGESYLVLIDFQIFYACRFFFKFVFSLVVSFAHVWGTESVAR